MQSRNAGGVLMADLIFGEEIADYLIDEDLFRDGPTATAAGAPPLWVDPDEGAEEPNDPSQPIVGTVITGLEIPGDWHMGFMQERAIEIRVRGKSRKEVEMICRGVRSLMEEKKHILMGQMLVQQSKLWRGVQKHSSDENSVTLTQSFRVAVRIEDLTV